jgi:hypothetical protein
MSHSLVNFARSGKLLMKRLPNDRQGDTWRESMQDPDLAFYSTQELVDELLRRQSFLGVIVQAADDNRQDKWPDERMFKVQFNNSLSTDQAGRLLEVVAEYMNIHLGE